MMTVARLVDLIDAFKDAACVESDGAISARMFNDGKKVRMLRAGGDITLGRAVRGINWLAVHWPADKPMPAEIQQAHDAIIAGMEDAA